MLEKDLSALYKAVAELGLLVLLNQLIEIAQARLFVNIHNRSSIPFLSRSFKNCCISRKAILKIGTMQKFLVVYRWMYHK